MSDSRHAHSSRRWEPLYAVLRGWVAPLYLAAALLALLTLTPRPSLAEEQAPSVSVEGQYLGRAGLSGERGAVSSSTGKVTATLLPVTLEYDVSKYSWRDPDRLPFGDKQHKPWNTLHLLSLTLDYAADIIGGFGYFAEATTFAGYEEEVSGSLGLNLTGGFSYAFSPDLKLNLGATGLVHRVHSRPLPVAKLDWNQNAAQGFSASLGFPENTLAYRFDKTYALRLAQTFDDTIYRLADDSSIGHKAYLESVGVVSGLYLDVTPLPGLTGSIGALYVLHRKFNMYDAEGHKRDVFSLDNGLGGVAHLQYSF